MIFVTGGPGSGVGAQCQKIAAAHPGVVHISGVSGYALKPLLFRSCCGLCISLRSIQRCQTVHYQMSKGGGGVKILNSSGSTYNFIIFCPFVSIYMYIKPPLLLTSGFDDRPGQGSHTKGGQRQGDHPRGFPL